jgi:hypothetical protein
MRYVLRAVGASGVWGAVPAVAVTAAAVAVAWCLHGIFGVSTMVSVVVGLVLGGLGLVMVALGIAAVVWLAGAMARLARAPSASPADLTPGNLPHRDTAGGGTAATHDDSEVWE